MKRIVKVMSLHFFFHQLFNSIKLFLIIVGTHMMKTLKAGRSSILLNCQDNLSLESQVTRTLNLETFTPALRMFCGPKTWTEYFWHYWKCGIFSRVKQWQRICFFQNQHTYGVKDLQKSLFWRVVMCRWWMKSRKWMNCYVCISVLTAFDCNS